MEGDENSVTMVDVLKEQEAFEEDAEAVLGASDDKNCTYPLGYIKRQALYACLTCCPESVDDPSLRSGVCLACSLACHEKHTFVELYTKRNFRCDCGGPKFKSKPCSFTGQKSEPNSQNQYNQNFSGLYCVCHRPYPDPDATEPEDEMIQCIVCEDWLHSQHLDSKLPPPDQYAEMICQSCMDNNDFLNDYLCYAVSVENKTDNDVSMELNVTTDDVSENANEKSIEQSEKVTETINPTENSQSVVDGFLVSNNEISSVKDQVESDAELVSGSAGDNIELNAIAPIANSESELDAKDSNISEMLTNSSESETNAESTKLTFPESAPNDVSTIKPIEEEESMEVDHPSAIEAITAENAEVITQNLEDNTEKNSSDKSVIGENLELEIQSSDSNVMEVNEKSEFDIETPVAVDSSLVPNPAGEINAEQFLELVKNNDENTTPKDIDNIPETKNVPVKDIDNITIDESGDITTAKTTDNITETEIATQNDVDNITNAKITDNITETEMATEKDIDNITTVKTTETQIASEKDIENIITDNITESEIETEKDIDNITTVKTTETEIAPEKDINNITDAKTTDNITESEIATEKDSDNITTAKTTDNITETEIATEKDVDDISIEKNSDVVKDSELPTEKDINNVTSEKKSDNITETETESSTENASDVITDIIIPPEKDIDNVNEPEIVTKNNTDIVTEKPIENDFSSKLDAETIDKITDESNVNIDIESEIKANSNPESIDLQENFMLVDEVIDSKPHSENGAIVDNESKENLNIDDKSLEATHSVAFEDSNHSATQVPNSNDANLCEEAESNVAPDEVQSVQMKEVSADNSGKDDIVEQSKTSEKSEVAISDNNDAASKESASAIIFDSVSEMDELMDTCEKPPEEPLVSNQTLELKGDINKSDAAESISEDSQLEPAIEKSLIGEIGMCPDPESQLSATNHESEITPASNEKPLDSVPIIETTKIPELVTDNSCTKDADPKTNDSETTCEIKDKKRKLEHDHVTIKGIAKKIKSEVVDCIRPAACLRLNRKGAAFWPSDWRSMLCSCPTCLGMYSERKVSFLIDVEDTITAYEHLGKIKTETSSSQYEKGMDALSSLGHVQQINAITEYNRMKEKLLEFLKTFKDKKEVVKEEDIKGFFAGMKPKREPDGVYFCQ